MQKFQMINLVVWSDDRNKFKRTSCV